MDIRLFALAVLLTTAISLAGCGETTATRVVTMDGRDAAAELTVDPINLWDNYQTRAHVTGRVAHGAEVRLIQQSGEGCQVETNNGIRGWVTCANFIKEFKR
jgi:SH3-like domain-containing protein